MSVTARFYVAEVTKTNGGQTGRVVLAAVNRGDQNRQWASATPVGRIELTINNMPAWEQFVGWQATGQDVAITMEPVPVRQADDGHAFRQAVDFEGKFGAESGHNSSWYTQTGLCGECGQRHGEPAAG